LTDSAQNGLSANLKCFKEKPVTTITVEGHCDERGTDAYNMELGTKRAKVVKDFLQSSLPKVKVKTMSYGKTKPLCSEDGEDCWGKNRRAEFKVSEK
jgi:peptidoglycan-associated lipoprotein